MKFQFKTELFNEQIYNAKLAEIKELTTSINAGVEALRSEGLPCGVAFIEKVTATPDALTLYIRGLAEERTGGKFLPLDEKSQIISLYRSILNRINDRVQAMGNILNSGKISLKVGEDGTPVPDTDAMEKLAKKEATTIVDAKRMEAYFEKTQELIQAIEGYRQYEKDNNLPSFLDGVYYLSSPVWRNKMTLDQFVKQGATPELFETVMRDNV